MAHSTKSARWGLAVLLAACCFAAIFALLAASEAVKSEARRRFFEQYNRHQLLLAEQASRSIEDLFGTLSRNLGMVGSLFEGGPVSLGRGRAARPALERVYGLMSDMPIIDLVVFDARGDVAAIVPADAYTEGRNYSWRSYFRWAKDTKNAGKTYLSPFLRLEGGQNRGDKALIVARGIYDGAGRFAGVTMCTIHFDRLVRSHVTNLRTDEGGYAWLVDSLNETVLVDPAGKLSGQTFAEAFGARWPRLDGLLRATRSGQPGMDWYEFEDPQNPAQSVRKLLGFAPVRIENQLWTLGVCTPEPRVEALLASYFQRTQEYSAAVLGIVTLGALALVLGLFGWNRALTTAVEARTRDLAQANERLSATFEELSSAQKTASIGEMALSLAHEIRNPLSSMRMNLNMLRRAVGEEEGTAENIAIMEEEIVRLNRLLGDVLTFARPARIHPEPVELAELVRRVLRLLHERIQGAQIRTVVNAPPEPVTLIGDPGQLHQLLLNLLLNAIESLQEVESPRVLTVELAQEDDAVLLTVSDTGGGLGEEEAAKIFEPFFTGKAQGLGLGLSIVKSIVSRHGGRVTARPQKPYGAVFTVTLPRDASHAEAARDG